MPSDEIDRADDVSVTPAPAAKKRRKKKAAIATSTKTSTATKTKTSPTTGGMPRAVLYGLVGGGLAACLGIALVATRPSVVGTWLLVAAIVTLVASIHRLGRLGPEGLA